MTTRPWDETSPTDSQLRSFGAQNARYAKIDLRERMETDHIFGGGKEVEATSGAITADDSGYHQRVTMADHAGTPPANPPADHHRLYNDAGTLKLLDSGGTEVVLTEEDDSGSTYMRKAQNLADLADTTIAQANLMAGYHVRGILDAATGAVSAGTGIASGGKVGTGQFIVNLSAAPVNAAIFTGGAAGVSSFYYRVTFRKVTATQYYISVRRDDTDALTDVDVAIHGFIF